MDNTIIFIAGEISKIFPIIVEIVLDQSVFVSLFPTPDSTKNRLANDAISHLMAHCCWQNMHIVPPHGVVYEIRTADGYGARWSEDGNEVWSLIEIHLCADLYLES